MQIKPNGVAARRHKLDRKGRLLVIMCLLTIGLLTACGGESTTVATGTTVTSTVTSTVATTVAVTITPEPTTTPAPTPTLVPPTATPIPPTATPEPPKPPNALVMGELSNPWGDITRYQPQSTSRLEEVKLNSTVSNSFATWFVGASQLAPLPGSSNLYQLQFSPQVEQQLKKGLLEVVPAAEGKIYAIARDPVTKKIVANGTLTTLASLNNPVSLAFTLISLVSGSTFTDTISSQFEAVNRNLQDIKNYLEQSEYSKILGSLNYIDKIRINLNNQQVDPSKVQSYLDQLEQTKREIEAELVLTQGYMDQDYTTYKDTRIDKGLFGTTRDEKKISDFEAIRGDYKRNASNQYLALSVLALSSQVSCALLGSCKDDLAQLQTVQKNLVKWRDDQNRFYDLTIARVPEMDGLFTSADKQTTIKKTAETAKTQVAQTFKEADATLASSIEKVNSQIQLAQLPTQLVVELDGQGKLVKVSRVVPVS